MSVICFTPEELAETFQRYKAIEPRRGDGPTAQDMGVALQAFHFANVMAYCLTYDDWSKEGMGSFEDVTEAFEAVCIPRDAHTLAGQREVVKRLQSYMYNVISNAGTDCLPTNYRETFEYACRSITERLAGIYS